MVISESNPLVLGSASPRRRDILASLGIPFRVRAANAPEDSVSAETPAEYLEEVVRLKLDAVRVELSREPVALVLVADTIVVVGTLILGKPRDEADARRLLQALAGNTHTVCTRYAIATTEGRASIIVERTVSSSVTMRSASDDELARYAATGEGLDKAGAYAVQGVGAFSSREDRRFLQQRRRLARLRGGL